MITSVTGTMTPALEIMVNSPSVKKLIEENRLDKLGAAIETGADDGSLSFNQSLFQLVKDGKVTQEHCVKYTIRDGVVFDSQALLADVRGMVAKAKQGAAAKKD
jgi:Tfp pilus assembly pilus retraction ATPase PilT